MKYLLACLEKDSNNEISEVFARATYFAIYDTEKKNFTYKENAAASASSGAGVKAAQEVIDSNIDKVIARRLGENSFDILKASEIEVLTAKADLSLSEEVALASNNLLEPMLSGKVGFHHA